MNNCFFWVRIHVRLLDNESFLAGDFRSKDRECRVHTGCSSSNCGRRLGGGSREKLRTASWLIVEAQIAEEKHGAAAMSLIPGFRGALMCC